MKFGAGLTESADPPTVSHPFRSVMNLPDGMQICCPDFRCPEPVLNYLIDKMLLTCPESLGSKVNFKLNVHSRPLRENMVRWLRPYLLLGLVAVAEGGPSGEGRRVTFVDAGPDREDDEGDGRATASGRMESTAPRLPVAPSSSTTPASTPTSRTTPAHPPMASSSRSSSSSSSLMLTPGPMASSSRSSSSSSSLMLTPGSTWPQSSQVTGSSSSSTPLCSTRPWTVEEIARFRADAWGESEWESPSTSAWTAWDEEISLALQEQEISTLADDIQPGPEPSVLPLPMWAGPEKQEKLKETSNETDGETPQRSSLGPDDWWEAVRDKRQLRRGRERPSSSSSTDPMEQHGITQRFGKTRAGVDRWHHPDGTVRNRRKERLAAEQDATEIADEPHETATGPEQPSTSSQSPLIVEGWSQLDEGPAVDVVTFYGEKIQNWAAGTPLRAISVRRRPRLLGRTRVG